MPRAIWSGSLSFGLVSIPVKLLSGVHEKSVSFNMLTPDGKCRVRQKLWCPETGKEYERHETVRGFEIAPDQYVIVEDEELSNLRPEAARTIDISEFVEITDIDPIFYDRSYYLTPERTGVKPYHLLVQAMQRSGKVALATFVMRQRQYLCAIRPVQGRILVLHTMHYADEVTTVDELEPQLGADVEVRDKELTMAESLIASLASDFQPEKYHDEYREKLEELLEAKASGQEVVVAPAEPAEEPRVSDLIAALEASLSAARARTGAAPRASAEEPPRPPQARPAAEAPVPEPTPRAEARKAEPPKKAEPSPRSTAVAKAAKAEPVRPAAPRPVTKKKK